METRWVSHKIAQKGFCFSHSPSFSSFLHCFHTVGWCSGWGHLVLERNRQYRFTWSSPETLSVKIINISLSSSVVVVYPLPWPLLVGGVRCSRACGPPASFSVHLASSAVTPAGSVHKSRGDNVVRMWVQLKRWCVSCVWMLQRGHSGDGCVLPSTLCKYDLRKGDLFVLSWARVRRVRRGSISSELLVCGGGVRSILLLPLVARCLETIDVCIWRMFVFMSVVVTVWGSVGKYVV